MEAGPSKDPHTDQKQQGKSEQKPVMSALTMPAPVPYSPFSRERQWDPVHPEPASQARGESSSTSLPSIRESFPDLYPPSARDGSARPPPPPPHHPSGVTTPSSLTSPHYIPSPQGKKRSRDSLEQEQMDERAAQVPRVYPSSERAAQRQPTPPNVIANVHKWATSPQSRPVAPSSILPSPVEIQDRDPPRPALPTLSVPPPPPPPPSQAAVEREAPRPPSRLHDVPPETYRGPLPRDPHPPPPPPPPPPGSLPSPGYPPGSYGYGYQAPYRYQPPDPRAYDHSPYAIPAYGPPYYDLSRYGEISHLAMGGDTRHRKRRGNLPKETTDKLRAWFIAHLSHPYPTEDEKQDLMRQTGLQMNQISNWFINARRRQLPAMINNARAESDATGSRNADIKPRPSSERGEYERTRTDGMSDGEGSGYDDDLGRSSRRRPGDLSRGSV